MLSSRCQVKLGKRRHVRGIVGNGGLLNVRVERGRDVSNGQRARCLEGTKASGNSIQDGMSLHPSRSVLVLAALAFGDVPGPASSGSPVRTPSGIGPSQVTIT